MKHRIRRGPDDKRFAILLIGAGGTGAEVLRGLAKAALAARELHQLQVEVQVMDGDTVSLANLVRQPFTRGDIGRNKAECLVNRYNLWFGLSFEAIPAMLTETGGLPGASSYSRPDLVITCVDNARTRALVHRILRRTPSRYWLDCGNLERMGQVILGEPRQEHDRERYGRLPVVTELFPELLDPDRVEPDMPSCSLAEALERQDLLVNEAIALPAKNLLWKLLTEHELDWHGAFVDLESGRTTTLAVDPGAWKRFGHRGARRPRPDRQ
jgi:sulfur-carrier protein adenylyltransferase/sulfurtransferase